MAAGTNSPFDKPMSLRHWILLLFLAISVLLSSCAAPGIVSQTDLPASLVQQSGDAARTIEDTHFRVELELSNVLLKDRQVLEIWYVRPDSVRIEILESTLPGMRDIIAASQGDEGWTYRHVTREVHIGPIDEVKPAFVYDVVRSALGWLYDDPPDEIDDVSTDYVNGKWAFKLTGSRGPDTCSTWLQQDTLRPLKLDCQSEVLGEYSLTVNDADYNLGLTDELFDLTLLPAESYTVQRVN